jgi:hypothetical protein
MQIYELFDEILDAARHSSGDWVVQRGPHGKICRELASCRLQAVANREAGALKPTHLCPISFPRPHMVLASPRAGIPVKRFLACPHFHRQTQITRGVSCATRDTGCGVVRRARTVSHKRKLVP